MFKKLACVAAVVGAVVTVGMGVAVAADDAGGVSVFGKAIYLVQLYGGPLSAEHPDLAGTVGRRDRRDLSLCTGV